MRPSTAPVPPPGTLGRLLAWKSVCIPYIVDELRAGGELVTADDLERISPLARQHIHLRGYCPSRASVGQLMSDTVLCRVWLLCGRRVVTVCGHWKRPGCMPMGDVASSESDHIPVEPVVYRRALEGLVSDGIVDLHYERLAKAKDIDSYAFPRLARSRIAAVYARVERGERELVAPRLSKRDYDLGTARRSNEVAIFEGERPVLITAEHATAHYRRDGDWVLRRKAPDVGTAGLGYALHKSTGAHLMTMRGCQCGDANYQEEHVFKDVMARLIVERGITQVISIHGMKAGKFNDFADERAYDVLLGVGPSPHPASIRAAERIERIAARFDLRVATNEWFVKVADDDPLAVEVNPDGTIVFGGFHAPFYTTRACAQRVAEENGLELGAVQVELSDLFRLLPSDVRRARRKRLIGTYVGYRLLQRAIEG